MTNPRHFEYYKCPECDRTWKVYEPPSYDATDSHPVYTPILCDPCWEEKNRADLAEQEAEEAMENAARFHPVVNWAELEQRGFKQEDFTSASLRARGWRNA